MKNGRIEIISHWLSLSICFEMGAVDNGLGGLHPPTPVSQYIL